MGTGGGAGGRVGIWTGTEEGEVLSGGRANPAWRD